MLAETAEKPFSNPNWVFEIKWDGYRAISFLKEGKVFLQSRNELSLNEQFPRIKAELEKIKIDAVLDGEIVSLNKEGKADFNLLQNHRGRIVYYVFDILRLGNRDLTGLPLIERKEILKKVLPESNSIKFVDYIKEKGEAFFNEVEKEGIEGAMAKKSDSVYEIGRRSPNWLKIKSKSARDLNLLTNLNKIFWPEEGYKKKDLIDYYDQISDYILPYLINRPMVLNRFPDGILGESFFQKKIENNPFIFKNKDSLIRLANLGCIEMNPWNSKIESIENPDYAVLDFDPSEGDFAKAMKIAISANRILKGFDIPHFIKTSGGKGIHFYIPLGAKYNHEQAKEFSRVINGVIFSNNKDISTLERNPEKRGGKVYLDSYQNGKGKTLVSAYSLRPRPKAPVSTPLLEEELNAANFNPENFNMKNIFKRIERMGDVWQGILGPGINMLSIIKKLSP